MNEARECIICGSSKHEKIHNGVRDNANIDVYRCQNCGLVFLSEFPEAVNQMYEDGEMHRNAYDVETDTFCDITIDKWERLSCADDDRRTQQLKDICRDKDVLEFGCGNGGFLKRIKEVAHTVTGIELETQALASLENEKIFAVNDIERLGNKSYDVIVMFNVIEHLIDPRLHLRKIYQHLKPDGIFVCETCNSEDALLSYYENDAYKDFTYWSEHVYLYNSDTLERLTTSCGFKTVNNTQIQRYPLANHLCWLNKGIPGGV